MLKSKRTLSLLLAVCAIISCISVTAFATEPEEELSFQLVDSAIVLVEDDSPSLIRANTNLTFNSLAKGYYKQSTSTYYINAGTDKLYVSSLTWTPTGQNVSVVLVNVQTGKTYAVEYSGGSISGKTISTSSLTSGEYYVGVANYDGPNAVSGTLAYDFT